MGSRGGRLGVIDDYRVLWFMLSMMLALALHDCRIVGRGYGTADAWGGRHSLSLIVVH